MRTEIKIIKIYKYDELTEEQKQKVLENLSNINVDFDWWEFIYDEVKELGFEITEFDIDRPNYCKIKFINSSTKIAEGIMKNHGDTCETYQHAKAFLDNWSKFVEKYSNGINKEKVSEENYDIFDKCTENLEDEFLNDLQYDYLKMLNNEYEYQINREAIEETIRLNEYEFTEDGKIY